MTAFEVLEQKIYTINKLVQEVEQENLELQKAEADMARSLGVVNPSRERVIERYNFLKQVATG